MRKNFLLNLFFTLIALGLVAQSLPIHARDDAYRLVQLEHGISIEIPAHWTVLQDDTRKNLAASSQAMLENAGIDEGVTGQKKGLLAANATPSPTGAMIRVSVTTPPDFTQSDLAKATTSELKEVEQELINLFRRMEASGGPSIVKMLPVKIEPFNNQRAMVIRYIRKSPNGPSHWQVTQYKIPTKNRLVELTLSSRQSDAVVWNPILERVKRSIVF